MSWFWRKHKKIPDRPLLFCECNDVDCLLFLPASEEDYLAIRTRYPRSAQVLPGHEDDADEILEIRHGWLVVQTRYIPPPEKKE